MGNKLDVPAGGEPIGGAAGHAAAAAEPTATATATPASPRPLTAHQPTIRPISPSVGKAAPRPGKGGAAGSPTNSSSTNKPTAAGGMSPSAGSSSSPAKPQALNVANAPAKPLRSLDSDDSPRDSPRAEGEAEGPEVVVEDIQRRYSHVGGKAVSIKDFDLLKVLGKGSFGKVMLVRYKGTGQLHAMKTLRKEALIRRNQLAHTSTERYVLQNLAHPFLMRLAYAFQSKEKLYMVVDYMAGGELFFWLKKGKFSESRAKLYAAEITLALEALHAHDIVYRDLKPENILLDAEGHVRLTDFGLSKSGVKTYGPEGGTHTFCGTPEYLAPEVLENKGHGKGIDWWSLGTLMYEMVCGLPPFYDQSVQKMYKKILTAPLTLPPKAMSEEARSVVKGLLERKVVHRLGCGPQGALEIKRHPYFACYDWDRVLAKGYQPDFVPCPPASTAKALGSAGNGGRGRGKSVDVENFDKEFTTEPAVDSVVATTLDARQQELANFEGFTYDDRHKTSKLTGAAGTAGHR